MDEHEKTKIAVAVFDKLADVYQQRFMDVSQYHSGFDTFCTAVKVTNATILELACGPGNITKYVLKQRPDFKIFGIDLAPNMVALAKANNPQADFAIMDCRDIQTLGKKYDAVMCGFCLPYFSESETAQLVHAISEVLNPDGVVYISTMETTESNQSGIKKSSSGDEVYMYYHNADFLVATLEASGFAILEFERQDYPAGGETDLILIARKVNRDVVS